MAFAYARFVTLFAGPPGHLFVENRDTFKPWAFLAITFVFSRLPCQLAEKKHGEKRMPPLSPFHLVRAINEIKEAWNKDDRDV